MVKNQSSGAGNDACLIPGLGTTMPHAAGQLSLLATATEPESCNERSRMCN